MVDAPERIWLGAPDIDNESDVWFDASEGGTPYIRADIAERQLTEQVECKKHARDCCDRAERELVDARAKALENGTELCKERNVRQAAEAERDRLAADNARLLEALKPFADIAGEDWADENGWTDAACQNDRVCDWFGPSAFSDASQAFRAANQPGGQKE